MPAVEQPSLLPKAVELLKHAGLSETALATQCNAPYRLFRQITARAPDLPALTAESRANSPENDVHAAHQIVSLLSS